MDEPVVEVLTVATPSLVDSVEALVGQVTRTRDVAALSDGRRRALHAAAASRRPEAFLAVVALDRPHGTVIGYAQVDGEGDPSAVSMESVSSGDDAAGRAVADQVLDTALAAVAASGGAQVRLWVTTPSDADDERALRRGFTVERELLQLRCPLPLAPATVGEVVVTTRPFAVGRDEEAWLATNNRAFAGHPEQGAWDLSTIRSREAEPWFDPDGFRVLELDGRLAGSCWTKRHAATPPLGEIYVISVDPDFHGRGLGRALTRAGLDWLAATGLDTGMLYVDGANTPAVTLYRSMGFTEHHRDRAYTTTVSAAPVLPGVPAP